MKGNMKDMLVRLSIKIKTLIEDEQGQDLIEYALVVALIAFAATVGMGALANGINTAFTHIGTRLTKAITSGVAACRRLHYRAALLLRCAPNDLPNGQLRSSASQCAAPATHFARSQECPLYQLPPNPTQSSRSRTRASNAPRTGYPVIITG